MKPLIWALIIFGFLFLMASNFFGAVSGFIGLIMIAGALFLGLQPGGILRKESTIDTWGALIDQACPDDGQERADLMYTEITRQLDESEAPNLKVERKFVSPTFLRSVAGQQREFLVLTDTTNYRLKPYQIYISARPYGVSISAEWFLTYKPKLWMSALSLIPYVSLVPKTLSDIDFFDQQDLGAYVSNAHHCTLRTVQELMEYLQQDPSKLNTTSKGFFTVS
jgi:hypothetical protein